MDKTANFSAYGGFLKRGRGKRVLQDSVQILFSIADLYKQWYILVEMDFS
jgi:hypothetical protein